MMELDRHIEILLLSNDCVIVPGLGAFVAHHVAAGYDEQEGLFFPPLRTVGFNPQITMNDSTLAQSYADAYDISYPEALKILEKEVGEIKKSLQEGKSYILNDIGKLSTNEDGNVLFEPCEAGLLTPSLYGLGSFEMPYLNDTDMVRTSQKVEKNDEDLTDKVDKKISIRMSTVKDLVKIAAILICSFLITPNIPGGHDLKDNLTQSSMTGSILTTADKSEHHRVDIKKTATIKTNKEKVAVEKKADKDINFWTIVLCSHVAPANAEVFKAELEKEGLKGEVIINHSGSAKVIFGHYNSEEDAFRNLNIMKDNERFRMGWVTKIER